MGSAPEQPMVRPLIAAVLALAALLSACENLKVQPLSPGAYFPLARGPN
jgi:hypothetical protein